MLKRANELACLGLGLTGSNPIVGAVVVSPAGVIIGEGFHKSGPHAEVVALEQADQSAKGATLFVTLEPCNHHGDRKLGRAPKQLSKLASQKLFMQFATLTR